MATVTEELICPDKNCNDAAYYTYINDYLVPSIYKETEFKRLLSEMPQLATFLLGKELFNSLNIIIESYRKYKNYEHLSNIDPDNAKNFKYLLIQNKKSFNFTLEKLDDQIIKRRKVFDDIILMLNGLTSVSNPFTGETYILDENTEMRDRLMYVIEMVKLNKNTFENSVISYTSGFESVAIA